MNKTAKIIIGAIVIILVIWGVYVSRGKQNNQGAIQIGLVGFPTGPLAAYGQITVDTVNLAVKDINAAGGVNGRKLAVLLEDYGYDPKRAIPAYEALKAKGIRFFMIDGSAAVSSVRPLVVQDGNLSIVSSATVPSYTDGNPRTCRLALTAEKYGPALADFIVKTYPKKRVAFLTSNNDFGKSNERIISERIKASGGTVVDAESFDQAANDFRTQITKLKGLEKDIDVLVVSNAANTVEATFKQLRDLKWSKPILAENWTALNPQLKDRTLAEGVIFADYSYVEATSSEDSTITDNFKREYVTAYGSYPSPHAANGYDAIQVLAAAMKKATELTPDGVAKTITQDIKQYDGVGGKVVFNDDCEVDRQVTMRVLKNGKSEALK